jgi:hypothetical protein
MDMYICTLFVCISIQLIDLDLEIRSSSRPVDFYEGIQIQSGIRIRIHGLSSVNVER